MEINTTHGLMDESLLLKRVDTDDGETGVLTTTEYCLKDCIGAAHLTGQPDRIEHFCDYHVHRSIDFALKQGVDAAGILNHILA